MFHLFLLSWCVFWVGSCLVNSLFELETICRSYLYNDMIMFALIMSYGFYGKDLGLTVIFISNLCETMFTIPTLESVVVDL